MRYFSLIIWGFLASHLPSAAKPKAIASQVADNPSKHVLFIGGVDTHGYGNHRHQAGNILMAAALKNFSPQLTTEIVYNKWPTQAQIDAADCLFIFSDGWGKHIVKGEKELTQLTTHMNKGGGLVSISYGAGKNNTTWKNLLGADYQRPTVVAQFYVANYFLPKGIQHPVAKGLRPHSLDDENWFNLTRADKTQGVVTPILVHHAEAAKIEKSPDFRGNKDAEAKRKSKTEFMAAWAFERKAGGRAFGHVAGRYHFNFAKDDFRRTLLNGILWTLELPIPEDGCNSATADASTMRQNHNGHSPWYANDKNLQMYLNHQQNHAGIFRNRQKGQPERFWGKTRKPSSKAPQPSLKLD